MVTDEMLNAYKLAHRAAVDEAMKDYTKIRTVGDDARKAGISAALEAALSAAEPVRWMWEERRFAESDIWDDMYDDEPPAPHKHVRNIRPLYAAPASLSVAVDAVYANAEKAYGIEYHKNGIFEDALKAALSSALSAQVKDVATPRRKHTLSLSDHEIRMMSEGAMIIGGAQMEMAQEIIFLRSLLPAAPAKQEGGE